MGLIGYHHIFNHKERSLELIMIALPLKFYALSGLINGLTSGILGILILIKSFKIKTNRIFAYFCFSVSFWSILYYFWLSTNDKNYAEFLLRTCMIGVFFMPSLFIHFVVLFLKREKPVIFYAVNYGLSIFFTLMVYTNYYAKDISSFLIFPYWLKAGILFHFVLIHFGIIVFYSFFLMWQEFLEAKGIFKSQLIYVGAGTFIGYLSGSTNYFAWYRFPVPPVLNILISLYVMMATYAIIRYHLMDLTLLARNTAIFALYFVTAFLVITPFFVLPFIVGNLNSLIYWLPLLCLIVICLPALHGFIAGEKNNEVFKQITQWIDSKVFRGKFLYMQSLRDFWTNTNAIFTTSQLAWTLVNQITDQMQLENCCFFLFKRTEMEFRPIAQIGLDDILCDETEKIMNSYDWDSPLPRCFKQNDKMINIDELNPDNRNHQGIIQELSRTRTQLSIPIKVAGRVSAIFNLGHKKNGDVFHEHDYSILDSLIKMAEAHLSHSIFLEETIFYSGSLAHDIKSPLKAASLANLMTDIEEAIQSSKGETKEKALKSFATLQQRLSKFRKMIELMVNISKSLEKFITGFKPENIDYKNLVNDIAMQYKPEIEKKGLTLDVEVNVIPNIYAERTETERVLSELIYNALKYTSSGYIKVKVYQEKESEVITSVIDSGRGIPETMKEYLFKPFRQLNEDVDGAGIGLASIQKLLDANGGRIWVKSEEGKGSTFSFALPAIQ